MQPSKPQPPPAGPPVGPPPAYSEAAGAYGYPDNSKFGCLMFQWITDCLALFIF